MDVAVVSCQECFFSKNAEEHIRTFFDKLVTADSKKLDVNLNSYDLKDLDLQNTAAEVHRSKVQIVIISHHFLQKLKLEATTRVRLSPVNRVFRPKRVIAVLVGVGKKEITDGYESVLARFGEWFSVELRSTSKLDPEFCKKFTEQVVKIYNLELSNISNFSVFPKKVTREQPKIVLMLKKPIDKDDEMRVEFTSTRKTEGLGSLKLENPYQAIIRVPESFQDRNALIEVSVYVNNQKLGTTLVKFELQSRHGDEDVIEKIANMVPGFPKLLDDHISQTLSKNFKECSDFITDPTIEVMNDVLICKGDEFPTVMHFAAYYGLEHTVWTLLDEADGIEQCSVMNESGNTASDVALQRGYDSIVQTISDYQEINNSWKALKYIKDLCGRASVMSLQDSKIVSKQKSRKDVKLEKIIPEDVDNAIREEEEKLENLQQENLESASSHVEEPQPALNSDGSYVTWGTASEEDLSYEKVVELPPAEEAPEVEKLKVETPKPSARSKGKKKREYINVKEGTRNAENPEEVQIRERAEHKHRYTANRQKRHSISPMQNYDIPRPLKDDYSIPPPGTRPVAPLIPAKPKEHGSPVLQKKNTGSLPTDDGYLVMNLDIMSPQPESKQKEPNKPPPQQYDGEFIPISALERTDSSLSDHIRDEKEEHENSVDAITGTEPSSPPVLRSRSMSSHVHRSDEVHLDPIDEELIQLMKDFPSSGYSMQQIELLFANWQSRTDVKRSIDEKKKYMRNLREEYKRIQHNTSSKKPSPLERIKVLMKGRKKSSNISPYPVYEDHRESTFTSNTQSVMMEEETRKLSKSQSSDRESYGSHEDSGGSCSGPDSGVSEPDSERDNGNIVFNKAYSALNKIETLPNGKVESLNNGAESPFHPKAPVWSDPHSKRFCPSYIPPEPIKSELEKAPVEDDNTYKVPPPPRPVTVLTPAPPLPQKPSVPSPPLSPVFSHNNPPPPPQKPSHMRPTRVDSTEGPPPPPPRTYKLPNVFSYIDYKSKSKDPGSPEINRSAKPTYPKDRPPYDNVSNSNSK